MIAAQPTILLQIVDGKLQLLDLPLLRNGFLLVQLVVLKLLGHFLLIGLE